MQITDQLPSGSDVRPTRVDWAKAKTAAMENPGKWVLMAENIASSIPDQLRKGMNKQFRGDELERFEFATRRPKGATYPKRRTDLWGRYTPEGGK
jgi:hypothetical protein